MDIKDFGSLEAYEKYVERNRKIATFKRNFSGWLIMVPSLILFVFFVWWPLVSSIRLSLFEAKGVELTEFAGFSNYFKVMALPDFWPAIKNTFAYTGWSLLIGFLLPIVVALIMSELVHWKGFFRIGTYFPNIMPGLATVIMWTYIFNPTSTGVINIIRAMFGLGPVGLLDNASTVIPFIVVALTWKGFGATALIYLASLQGISQELYEAAAIDGASIWNRIRYITIPNLYGVARQLLILQIISVFQILYEPLVMTGGGPKGASLSIMQLVYDLAFEKSEYEWGAAVSVVIFIMLMAITIIYNKLIKEQDM